MGARAYPSLEPLHHNPELVGVLHDLLHLSLPQMPFAGVLLHHQDAPLAFHLLAYFLQKMSEGEHESGVSANSPFDEPVACASTT